MKAQNTIRTNFKNTLMCLVLSFFILVNPLYNNITISYLMVATLCVSLCLIRSHRYSTTENILLYSSFAVALILIFTNSHSDVLGIFLLMFFSISLHKELSANSLLILLLPVILILILKSVFSIQIGGLSSLNGFYVNTSILLICLYVIKRDKINGATIILLIVLTILFAVIKSRLGFIVTCSLLVFKIFDHFKSTRFRVVSVLIFLSTLIPLLIAKKVSIAGRMHINAFVVDHINSLKLFDYNPFTNWYHHTIVNHNAIEISQTIGEVYNVAFNDYVQILIQYGIVPFMVFVTFNLYIFYVLLKRKKGLYMVCFLMINLMLLTSYPFFIPASLFFLILFYIEIAKKEKVFKLNFDFPKTMVSKTLSLKVITVVLVMALVSVYYYPKYVLFQESERAFSINELLDSPLTQHAFRNHELKYWVAKEYISKDSKNAKNIFLYLNDKCLTYNMLLLTGETFERLGEYEEASKYYKRSQMARPFALLPVYKQILIHSHLNKEKEVYELLNYYKDMELRVENGYTDIMKREIHQIMKKYKL